MSLIDVILTRRSVRRYEQRQVPDKALKLILEAGRSAPSAMNRQPWHFVVVSDPKLKQGLSEGGRWRSFIKDSAVTIVGCSTRGRGPAIDTAIAMENMVIAAWALGVGSCWVGDFDSKRVKQLLAIPEELNVVALLPLGYPAEQQFEYVPRDRKPLEEMVHLNGF